MKKKGKEKKAEEVGGNLYPSVALVSDMPPEVFAWFDESDRLCLLAV